LTAFDFATIDKFYNTLQCTDINAEISQALDVEVNVVDNQLVTVNNAEGAASKIQDDSFLAKGRLKFSLTSCTIYREEQNIRRIFIGHFKSTS
jgi:hypothetical protein